MGEGGSLKGFFVCVCVFNKNVVSMQSLLLLLLFLVFPVLLIENNRFLKTY